VFDSKTKQLSIGSLDNINNGLKLVDNSSAPVIKFEGSLEIVWAPDSEKFAVVTGNYYRDEKMYLSLWSKNGVREPSLTVENVDHISFAWGENSDDYAYVVGVYENNGFTNTLYVDSRSNEIKQSQNPTGLYILPDKNLAFGDWSYVSYLVDRINLNTELIPGEPYYLRQINNNVTILDTAYLLDVPFILADKNGFHTLEFSSSEIWSWNWINAEDGLWLMSGNQILNLDTNESRTLNLPDSSTIVAWTPANYYSNFSVLPTVSPPLDLGVFTCNAWQVRAGNITLARRTCSCGEFVCNCIDYRYGGSTTEWTRDRGGVEEYFSKSGGSCSSP
jgi:hypothetical protein